MKLFRLLVVSTAMTSTAAHAEIDFLTESSMGLTPRGSLIAQASTAAKAAYNDTELVGLQYKPLRNQEGFQVRDELVKEGHDVVGFSARISEKESAPAGIVAYGEENGKARLTVAFHGSEAVEDFTEANLLFARTENSALGIKGKIHTGFNSRYMQSREALHDVIEGVLSAHGKSAAEVDFVVTGHSLGGALATLAAADIKKNIAGDARLHLVTFCSPRVVNGEGAKSIETAIGKNRMLRVWRGGDVVPAALLGTITGYKHVGTSIKLEQITADPRKVLQNHSMDSIQEEATSAKMIKPQTHEGFGSWLKNKFTSFKKWLKIS